MTNPAQDMALLAACNHTIISYGNFGFWGAYFGGGGGEVILAGNLSHTPTELQHSISKANISNWQFFPAFWLVNQPRVIAAFFLHVKVKWLHWFSQLSSLNLTVLWTIAYIVILLLEIYSAFVDLCRIQSATVVAMNRVLLIFKNILLSAPSTGIIWINYIFLGQNTFGTICYF